MKNIDKLRKMSPKKLTKWLYEVSCACWGCDKCIHCGSQLECEIRMKHDIEPTKKDCKSGILKWLQADVK